MLFRSLAALTLIRSESLDVLIDTSQWSRFGAILCALSGAPFVIGFKTEGQHRHFSYDATVRHRANCHEIDYNQCNIKDILEYK